MPGMTIKGKRFMTQYTSEPVQVDGERMGPENRLSNRHNNRFEDLYKRL
jgi:hypothetical protein